MLTQNETDRVWGKMVEAEVRSLYFGELASRYSKRKQILAGLTFFLSSAGAVIASKVAFWLPALMSASIAVMTAYTIATGLDRRVLTMAKLHGQWNQIASDYGHLWEHWYEDRAEEKLADLIRRSREASEVGTTDAPYDEQLMEKWQERVYAMRAAV